MLICVSPLGELAQGYHLCGGSFYKYTILLSCELFHIYFISLGAHFKTKTPFFCRH